MSTPHSDCDDGVEQPITIGIMGAHSTGKSTLLARIAHELRLRKIAVATLSDLGEQAKRLGIPILHNHTWASTQWFITRGISNEIEAWCHAEVVLVDRAVPDALGYYLAALHYRNQTPDPSRTGVLAHLVRTHSPNYNLLFRTTLDPALPLGTDKPRDSDQLFRQLADHHVGRVADDLGIPCRALAARDHDRAITDAVDFVFDRLQ